MKFSSRENQVNPFMAMMAYCRCWEKVRFVPVAVLLLAAGLKTHQLATVPVLGEDLLHNRWFNIFVVVDNTKVTKVILTGGEIK